MKKLLVGILACTTLLTGCATLNTALNTVTGWFSRKPATQTAPSKPAPQVAQALNQYIMIQDSVEQDTETRAKFFVVSKINGQDINNALSASRKASRDGGYVLPDAPFVRTLEVRQITLTLQARLAYKAPIFAQVDASNFHYADHVLSFTPKPNTTYVVRGKLDANTEDVWLEEADTGLVVKPSRAPSFSGANSGGFHLPDWLNPSNWW